MCPVQYTRTQAEILCYVQEPAITSYAFDNELFMIAYLYLHIDLHTLLKQYQK